jgi:hypothetical protein
MGHLKTSTVKVKNDWRGMGSDDVNWTTLAQGLVENNIDVQGRLSFMQGHPESKHCLRIALAQVNELHCFKVK